MSLFGGRTNRTRCRRCARSWCGKANTTSTAGDARWMSRLRRCPRRSLLFTPIAGIAFAPVFDTLAVFRAAEVILVLRFLLPAALTLRFALFAASRLGAVALMTQIAMIRLIELFAAKAFALARTLHRATQKCESPLLQDPLPQRPAKDSGDRTKPKKSKQNEE